MGFLRGRQKFCDYCDMPVEMCECAECENCEKELSKCDCEICGECDNFIEYCECDEKVDITKSRKTGPNICVDCGFHTLDCECDVKETQDGQRRNEGIPKEEEGEVCEQCGEVECNCSLTYSDIKEMTSTGTKVWRGFLTFLILTMIAITLAIGYFVYDGLFKEPEVEYLSTDVKYQLATDALLLMYSVRDVQDIINNQESLMSKVTPEVYPKLDISDESLYMKRYASFSNSLIEVDFNSYTKTKSDNQIIINYTLRPVADLPVTRMAIIDFNNESKVTSFIEYTVNEIK